MTAYEECVQLEAEYESADRNDPTWPARSEAIVQRLIVVWADLSICEQELFVERRKS